MESGIKEENPYERLYYKYKSIKDLIDKIKPDFVVLEEVHFNRNFKTFRLLAQMQGMILGILMELDMGFTIIEPSTWRKFVGIKDRKREDQKKSAIARAKDIFVLDGLTDDEAEAILIGCWAIRNLYKKEQREMVS